MEHTYKLQVAFCEVRLQRGNNPNTTNAANGHFAHLKKKWFSWHKISCR